MSAPRYKDTHLVLGGRGGEEPRRGVEPRGVARARRGPRVVRMHRTRVADRRAAAMAAPRGGALGRHARCAISQGPKARQKRRMSRNDDVLIAGRGPI